MTPTDIIPQEPLEARLNALHTRLQNAAQKAGRDPQVIKLIAVSKFHTQDEVLEAIHCGQRIFWENRVQEALQKYTPLRQIYNDLELHLIGPLQTNKAEDAVRFFDVIQTLDRPNLAQAIAKAIEKTGKNPRLSLEINMGREPQKAGILPEDLETFLTFCRKTCFLKISGLMCIPPQGAPPRAFFQNMKKMAQQFDLPHISMGMSQDFEEAIEEGATEVRLGTAIFGPRTTA